MSRLPLLVLVLLALAPAVAAAKPTTSATAVGTGGSAATVDALATDAAVDALRRGANAVDAAVSAAAVLTVTEPYSCGIGGGGFLVVRLPDGRVRTIDHRETAPEAMGSDAFIGPNGVPMPFAEAVTSGLGVGVPGTVRGWDEALDRYGSWSLARALRRAVRVADRGFTVDQTFFDQTQANAARFADFPATAALFLDPDGTPRDVGSTLRNPDYARTLELLSRRGPGAFYNGALAADIVDTVRQPPVRPGTSRTVRPGLMTLGDLADYEARIRRPTRVSYRGYDIYGMAPPSSGGSTVGEALNILEGFDELSGYSGNPDRAAALHRVLEASRFSFADRNQYIGDPEFVDVPLAGLLSDSFAAERRALIGSGAAQSPVAPGDPYDNQSDPSPSGPPAASASVERSGSTTHLTVADGRGTVVSYTFTIEQTGGSAITVPGRGFLLNNELTDFNLDGKGANAPEPGKRPRSSMSPTIVVRDGAPVLAVGSPGGATIITTVLQILVDRLDMGASLPAAIAAPRASQRNAPSTQAEPGFERAALEARGHVFATVPEIGAVTAIEFLPGGRQLAAAEPTRRGGGAAGVVRPSGG